MKFGVVTRFVLHTLQGNIAHLAVITRKTNIKLGILKEGNWKRAEMASPLFFYKSPFLKKKVFLRFEKDINNMLIGDRSCVLIWRYYLKCFSVVLIMHFEKL